MKVKNRNVLTARRIITVGFVGPISSKWNKNVCVYLYALFAQSATSERIQGKLSLSVRREIS
jgi:hypothetical protein